MKIDNNNMLTYFNGSCGAASIHKTTDDGEAAYWISELTENCTDRRTNWQR